MRYRSFFAALALMAWASGPAGARAGLSEARPSALASLRSGDLVVLDAQQGLFLLSPATGRIQPLVAGFGLYEGSDMASTVLDGGDAIFVTMNLPSVRGGDRSQLVRYNAAGARTGAWTVPRSETRLSGIAVDAQKKKVYVASTQPPEIYTVDLAKSARGGFLVRAAGAPRTERAGPMVLDSRRGRLLFADPYLGRVYAYDLASGRSEALLEKVGEVAALAFDATGDRLFLADANGQRILAADLSAKSSAAKLFAQSKEFDEPLGLALDAAGGLWVGDRGGRKVFQFSNTGQQLRTLPLRLLPLPTRPKATPH